MNAKRMDGKHKTKSFVHSVSFVKRYDKNGNELFSHILVLDSLQTSETKREFSEEHHSNSLIRPRKFKQQSKWKVMATVFWDRKSVLLIDFLSRGITINAEGHSKSPTWTSFKKKVNEVLTEKLLLSNRTSGRFLDDGI